MPLAFADIAFTPSVQAEQAKRGSSTAYGKFLSDDRWGGDQLGLDEAQFLSQRDGFFQATVSETGWPYVQFRGGAPGFLRTIDAKTLVYADLRGNRQYISAGNLNNCARISLIAVDYPNQRRLKLWGEATFVDPATVPKLAANLHTGKEPIERIVKITVAAIDWNCPRHIPRRFTAQEYSSELQALRDENRRLTAQISEIQAQKRDAS